MKIIKDKLRADVRSLLSENRDFMLYRLPGRTPKLVTASTAKVDVRIVGWNEPFADAVVLGGQTERSDLEFPESTAEEFYIRQVNELIERLKQRGRAKTVYSRVIAGKTPDTDWIEVADELWQTYPDTFGYLFNTGKTGTWLGATPEKLVFTFFPDRFTTCALAGTLPVDRPWDRKTYDEQQMVADFIKDTLLRMNLDFEETGPRDLRYGNLKHLLTNFSGHLSSPAEQTIVLLDRLSPTPALCGLPRDTSLRDIEELENHSRQCYGGYIYIKDDTRMYSYVTIRCVRFDAMSGKWAMYVGGGITPASDARDEWNETVAKAANLYRLITHKDIE